MIWILQGIQFCEQILKTIKQIRTGDAFLNPPV